MKVMVILSGLVALGLIPSLAVKTNQHLKLNDEEGERPITKIVNMLNDMGEQSKSDGEEDLKVFQKFECYCKKAIANKTKSITALETLIEDTEIMIERLIARNDENDAKRSQLEKDLTKNSNTQLDANGTRANSKAAFEAEYTAMNDNLKQLNDSLAILEKEETLQPAKKQDGATGGESAAVALLANSSNPALLALSDELKEVAHAESASQEFLQPQAKVSLLGMEDTTPGEYDKQGGGVLGVVRSTRDTYIKNLAQLQAAEDADIKSHEELIKTLLGEKADLDDMLSQTLASIASTDKEIGTRKTQLTKARDGLAAAQTVKSDTESTLVNKTTAYEKRKLLQSEEQAAIAQAVSVLNSDSSFAAFGKTEATSSKAAAAFIQFSSSHTLASKAQSMNKLYSFLRQAASTTHSARLARLAAFAGKKPWSPEDEKANPFKKVLDEISNMQTVISKEGKADQKKFEWCQTERANNNKAKRNKEKEIGKLNGDIDSIDETLNSPTNGLLMTLENAKSDLKKNQEDQTSMTAARKEENTAYQRNIANLQTAQGLIKKALKILNDYYNNKIAFVQVKIGADPADDDDDAPEYNRGKYEGQNEKGQEVIQLVQSILEATQNGEEDAHTAEQKAQVDFEDTMKHLTDEEAQEKTTIKSTTKEIAEKSLELDQSKLLRAETTKEKTAMETYLKEIKPSCDFITSNFDHREADRKAETEALTNTITLIKNTPAYQQFEEAYAEEWKNIK